MDGLEQRFIRIVETTPWLLSALEALRRVRIPHGYIGAGAIRNAVWDRLHGHAIPSFLSDVDVVYFDASDLSQARDVSVRQALINMEPGLPWEATNQASVHLWYESWFGNRVEPLTSIEDAVATWPETATSVAVSLNQASGIDIIAPLGLQDLFDIVIRRNPRRVTIETYRERIRTKRYGERWPLVKIIEE
jgi:uncharacterized protein